MTLQIGSERFAVHIDIEDLPPLPDVRLRGSHIRPEDLPVTIRRRRT